MAKTFEVFGGRDSAERGRDRLAADTDAVGRGDRRQHLAEFGIPLVHDLPGVGQNLRDHPIVWITWKTKEGFELDGLAPAQPSSCCGTRQRAATFATT